MRVLVGIPTFRRPDGLRRCLESVLAQQFDGDMVAFVADNDPLKREGISVADEFGVSSAVAEKPGVSAARNAILQYAARVVSPDFIAMIDDDETASPQWLSELLKTQAAWDADVVAGKAKNVFEDSNPDPRVVRWFGELDFPEGLIPQPPGTNNVLLSTRALYKANWPAFDDSYGLSGGGDFEWFTRLEKQGFVTAWSPNALTFERVPPNRTTVSWTVRRSYRRGQTFTRVLRTHRPTALIPHLARAAATLMASPALAILAISPRWRLPVAWKLSIAAGSIGALFGIHWNEYALRR